MMAAPETARPESIHHGGPPHLGGAPSRPRPWLGPLFGVIFVVMLAVSFGLDWSTPSSDATGPAVISYYSAHSGRANTSALLIALSIPAGLFFFVFLREYLRTSPTARPFTTVALAGAVVFAVSGCVTAGLTLSLADVPTQLSPSAAQALNVLASDASAGLLIGGLSTMQFGFGVAILAGRQLPRWLGWLTILIAVVSLLGPLVFAGLLATAVWALIVSALLYQRPTAPTP
jgi:hypothetical protein